MTSAPDVPAAIAGGQTIPADVVVVGAGVAGLVAALDLLDLRPDARVVVIDKGTIGSSGSTPLAQGGMAAAVGPGDSPALHAADTLRAGDGLCDAAAVAVMAAEGPARVEDLVRRGAIFDRDASGALSLAREGGQSVPRSVRAADATGAAIFAALRRAATGRVTRLQGFAAEIATTPAGDAACGVWVLLDEVDASPTGPAQTAGLALISAPAILLATGGCGGLFAATTNRDAATADGVALAYRAGAGVIDLEFVQFHPTGLRVAAGEEGFWRLLLTEALRGAGAHLVDADGRRFMPELHPDAELAPRHVVTKGILDQSGGAWLDARHLGADVLAEEFPTVLSGARAHGWDLATQPVPVEPCEHYMIGGVATDTWGRTSLPGLSAAGECASTGVHGANRMAGNSLLQSCVFGHRVARDLAERTQSAGSAHADPAPPALGTPTPASEVAGLRARLRQAMTAGAGAIRSANGLAWLGSELDAVAASAGEVLPAHAAGLELANALTVGRLMARSAVLRTESRGVHWREDAPGHDPSLAGLRLRAQRPSPR